MPERQRDSAIQASRSSRNAPLGNSACSDACEVGFAKSVAQRRDTNPDMPEHPSCRTLSIELADRAAHSWYFFNMRLVATDPDTLVEWLYPGTHRDLETRDDDLLDVEGLDFPDLNRLAEILGVTDAAVVPSGMHLSSVGVPHDAPDSLPLLSPRFVSSALAVPAHERWRTSESWARAVLNRGPNDAARTDYKRKFTRLCTLFSRAGGDRGIVVLPD